MEQTEYTSPCCGSCRFVDGSKPSLRCRRSRITPLIVDAFFECPLWRGKEARCGKDE